MNKRECENCGDMFPLGKHDKRRFCSSECEFEKPKPLDVAGRLTVTKSAKELELYMSQPEVAQLRAGIQVALRSAWTRCFG